MQPYFQRDGITLYHGDCREILPSLPKVDLVLTDPPYGIGEARKDFASRSNAAIQRDYGKSAWDDAPPSVGTIGMVVGSGDQAILWGGNFFHLPPSPCWLVWDKDRTGDFADCELAWTNLSRAVRKIRFRWNGMIQEHAGADKEPRFHPTQKPVPVMKWAIELADDPETILDPFAGSGTTLRAAMDLGRKAIGIEISEKYCEIAARRLEQRNLQFQECLT